MRHRSATAVLVAACAVAGYAGADEGLRLSLTLTQPPALPEPAARASIEPAAANARPVGARDYRIGPEDLLDIQVFGVDQLSRSVRVNSRGHVSLPLIGAVPVAGLTAQEAEQAISRRLAENYLQNPQVSLFIKEFTTQRVTIEGAVNRPGIYPLRGQTTLLTSLAMAGGQAALSDMQEVMLFRADASGRRAHTAHDVEKIRRGEAEDPVVVNDDLIVVNRSKSRTVLRDSLFRDVIETVNPLRWGQPLP